MKHIKTRLNFVEMDEVLLPISKCLSGALYSLESSFFGRQYQAASLVIHEFDDHVVQILRFSRSQMSAEDVTEEIAEAYLNFFDADEGVTLDDEKRFPEYVSGSAVWARRKDDLEAERPVLPDPDRTYDERRDRQAMGWVGA